MNILQLGIFGVKRHKEEKAKRLNAPLPDVKVVTTLMSLTQWGETSLLAFEPSTPKTRNAAGIETASATETP